jgi:hypothetical protein
MDEQSIRESLFDRAFSTRFPLSRRRRVAAGGVSGKAL